MLASLAITNVVLIDKLSLQCGRGLLALTGETGAGKSILLDALGLALGARADAGLIRHGQDQASVTAVFDLPSDHAAWHLLQEQGLESDDSLILRRTINTDGRSKAFINDQPISISFLRTVGQSLVEIHGQFETQGLLDPRTHRAMLDAYASNQAALEKTRQSFHTWKQAQKDYQQALNDIEQARAQEDYLRHVVAELQALDPQVGEEALLASKRSALLNREKLIQACQQIEEWIAGENGAQNAIGAAQSILSRLPDATQESLSKAIQSLDAAQQETQAALAELSAVSFDQNESLEEIEDRYFALRDCAKKHGCTPDDLPELTRTLAQKLSLVTEQETTLQDLQKAQDQTKQNFFTAAAELSKRRRAAATKLEKAVMAELKPLKLDKAVFTVDITTQDDSAASANGIDHIQFMIATNAGSPAGPLNKIASGGELSRFMLAVKVVLAKSAHTPVLVFDELDSGVGGATADAIGERLARLSNDCQVLVVTHSPQVAARAHHHWVVAKNQTAKSVSTEIIPLTATESRQEEIARMLSGSTITREARAAAAKLLEHHDVAA